VVDSSLFRKQTRWTSTLGLEQSLQRAYDFHVASGMLNQAS
jgi:hypothetical protein